MQEVLTHTNRKAVGVWLCSAAKGLSTKQLVITGEGRIAFKSQF